MNSLLRNRWPLLTALALFGVALVMLLKWSMAKTEGTLVYPLDDTYIHMAMAKNVALHRVWGTSPRGFSSSTSSPLWTALIAASFIVAGVRDATPLVLSIVSALLTIWTLNCILRPYIANNWALLGVLLLGIFVMPLPALTCSGMEHVLHALVTLWLVACAVNVLTAERGEQDASRQDQSRRAARWLMILVPAITMVRYEGLILVAVVCGLLLLRGRWWYAITLGTLAWAPVAAYGLWSMSNGWMLLPNSVIIKGHIPNLDWQLRMFALTYDTQDTYQLLVLLFAAAATLLATLKTRKPWSPSAYWLLIFSLTAFAHLQVSRTGWFFRYDAYLMLLGIVALGIAWGEKLRNRASVQAGGAARHGEDVHAAARWRDAWPRWIVVAMILYIVGFPLGNRAVKSYFVAARAPYTRWLQHIQPAKFVAKYYNNATIVVNDIGAMAYYTDAKVLDMFGLGSFEPLAFRRGPGGYEKEDLRDWAKQERAAVAFLQIEWEEVLPRIPDQWQRVALWHVPYNDIFGDRTIGVFAVDSAHEDALVQNLRTFAAQLPRGIEQTGKYVKAKKSP